MSFPTCRYHGIVKATLHKLLDTTLLLCSLIPTVIAGTIFEKTRTELLKWFWAIYLIAHDKRGISATQLSEELKIAYQTAWTIEQKIRKAMGVRDASYSLAGIVELDEGFFGAPRKAGNSGAERNKIPVGGVM